MDSPSQWQSSLLEQDALPSTSAFVAPGQENFFFVQAPCPDSSPGQRRAGSVPASPVQLHNIHPVLLSQGSYFSIPNYLISQELPVQTSASPANRQPVPQIYQVPGISHQNPPAHLAALDLAAISHSPSRNVMQNSPSRMFSSPTPLTHGLDSGMQMYTSTQQSYLGYDPASQHGPQHQHRLQPHGQQSSMQTLGPRFAAVAGPGPGNFGEAAAGMYPYVLAGSASFPVSYTQQQQQQRQSGSPINQQPQQVLVLRSTVVDQYGAPFASPSQLSSQQQSPPLSGGGGGGGGGMHQGTATARVFQSSIGGPAADAHAGVLAGVNNPSQGTTAREGMPGTGWASPDVTAPPPASLEVMAKAGPGANIRGSPHPAAPVCISGVVASAGGGGGGGVSLHGGAVRHVVEELRTSPLILSSNYDAPVHGSIGGGGRTTGGTVQDGDNGSSEKNAMLQRYQAQILSLERQNAELQKRLADTHAALDAAYQARQALEAKQDAMADQVAQANHSAKSRESALENARRANDALSGELRSCQEELAAVRNALAAAKDTAVQWQDRALEVGKELEAAKKKIETLGEEERRLSAENMALRKEVQQLNDVIIKGRIECAELREKLRSSQQETARASSTAQALASRAESEQEGATVQMALMRNKVVELESRNSQLLYDMAGLREEVARARQSADAAKAALAAKPAGIATDGSLSARQHHGPPHGLVTTGWTAYDAQPAGSGGGPGAGSGIDSGAYGAYSGTGYGGPYGGAGVYGGATHIGGGGGSGSIAVSAMGSGGTGSVRISLPLPPQQGPPTSGSSLPLKQTDSNTGVAILRDLPSDVAFSKLDPETFRSMVRAEAEAMARGGGGSGLYGEAGSPLKPSHGTRYGSDLAVEPSVGNIGTGMPPPPRTAWGQDPGRDLAGQPPPAADAGGMWRAAPPPLAEGRTFASAAGGSGTASNTAGAGAGSSHTGGPGGPQPPGGSGSGSPPPYAINVTDRSYAYRRPANAVGAGVAPPGGGGGTDSPFGTDVTLKEMMARSKALEDQLMVLCAEKGGLEAEYARMPLGAGRSLRERNRKQVVEQRLELLNKEISSVRMQLKRLGVK